MIFLLLVPTLVERENADVDVKRVERMNVVDLMIVVWDMVVLILWFIKKFFDVGCWSIQINFCDIIYDNE